MKKILFESKNIYKANMHCHTTVSDGALTPEEIKKNYKEQGYSVVAFTDHNLLKPQNHLNDDGFLAINACEIDINQKDKEKGEFYGARKTYHFNFYATQPDMVETPPLPGFDYSDLKALNKYIKARVKEGFLVCYNHPYWSLQDYSDYIGLKKLFAMEIYNHNCELEGYYGHHPQVYDDMLRMGHKIFCFATDDNHNEKGRPVGDDSFGGYIQINSPALSYSDIMDSLISGDFYSSQAPEINEISMDGNTLYIKSSNVELIAVYTAGRRCYSTQGTDINEAAFELKGNEKYIRIMCRDKNGRNANSNAYWL